jgi:hypothetical protein
MTQFWKPGDVAPKVATAESAVVSKKTSSAENTVQLSKAVMGMKFMKRKRESDEFYALESSKIALSKDKYINEIMSTDEHCEGETRSHSIILDSTNLLQLAPGRRSFGGFNKAIERYYQSIVDEDRLNKSGEESIRNTVVSDQEMLNRYENLIGLPRGPNQGLRSGKLITNTNNKSNRRDTLKVHTGNKSSSNKRVK